MVRFTHPTGWMVWLSATPHQWICKVLVPTWSVGTRILDFAVRLGHPLRGMGEMVDWDR